MFEAWNQHSVRGNPFWDRNELGLSLPGALPGHPLQPPASDREMAMPDQDLDSWASTSFTGFRSVSWLPSLFGVQRMPVFVGQANKSIDMWVRVKMKPPGHGPQLKSSFLCTRVPAIWGVPTILDNHVEEGKRSSETWLCPKRRSQTPGQGQAHLPEQCEQGPAAVQQVRQPTDNPTR